MDGQRSPSRGSFYPTYLPKLELFSGYGTPFFPRRAASAHMTKSLALDPHDPSSRGDLLPSRAGIPPRVASIIWNRNFPSLLYSIVGSIYTAECMQAASEARSQKPFHIPCRESGGKVKREGDTAVLTYQQWVLSAPPSGAGHIP